MLRLEPAVGTRLADITDCRVHVGGSEANVASHLARWQATGTSATASRLITVLPESPLGERALAYYRAAGVDVSEVIRGPGRMGLYFTEPGAGPRATRVLYDRAGSAFAQLDPEAIDWPVVLADATGLHLSGITPALGAGPLEATRRALDTAAALGIPVSFDLNYRAALWSPREAAETITPMLENLDLLIAPSTQVAEILGVPVGPMSPDPRAEALLSQARLTAERYGPQRIALTLRDGRDADRGGFSAVLYDAASDRFTIGPRHETSFADRVGGGDAFAAGLLFASAQGQGDDDALAFASAAAALAHTVIGDAGRIELDEVEHVAAGSDGRIQR